MATVKVLDVRKMIVPTGPRLGQMDTVVTYQEDGGGIFLATAPKENPSDQEIVAAIKADQDQRHRLTGKSLTI